MTAFELGKPFLTFDSHTSQISLWDPAIGVVTTVPGADVAIVHVESLSVACPAGK